MWRHVTVLTMKKGEPITLQERIAELVHIYGSLREVARVVGLDAGYLSRLSGGSKTAPSERVLSRLGLTARTTYERK